MVVVSYSGKEINAKIVYYGPGLCGKTTNLERIYEAVPAANKGKMISMKTKADRTLFFDFLPLELGEVGGFRTRLMLYTVPGQVFYNATRKLVLKGVDALVFVADSERGKMQENQASLENLRENLESYGMDLDELPLVFQYNKRDLPSVYTREELDQALKRGDRPMVEGVAAKGEGVFETLRLVSELLLTRLRARLGAASSAPRGREEDPTASRAERPTAAGPIAQAPPVMHPGLHGGSQPAPAPGPVASADTPASPPRPRVPLGQPIPLAPRPVSAGAQLGPKGPLPWRPEPGATPQPEPHQLEIVRLDSAVQPEDPDVPEASSEPLAAEAVQSDRERDHPAAPTPAGTNRLVVPVRIERDDIEDVESIEIVLRLEIGQPKARRQVSG